MHKKEFKYNSRYIPKEFSQLTGRIIALKSHTGSGGTTAILKSEIPSIIVTPNVSQIKSKEEKDSFNNEKIQVLFLYKGSKDKLKDYNKYLQQGKIVHIYTTYKRLVIDKHYLIKNFSETHRLVADEYHILSTNEYLNVTDEFIDIHKEFKNVLLTTATPPHVNLFKGFEKYLFLNTSKKKKDVSYHKFETNQIMLNELLNVVSQNDKNHTIIFTNDIKVHAKTFEENDNIVGKGLEKKVAIYNTNNNYKTIDYSKKIHVISSSGFEGLDFEEDANIFVLASFNHNPNTIYKQITKIDLIQAIGRVRKETKNINFFYTMANGFIETLKVKEEKNEFHKEQKKGILALFSDKINETTLPIRKVKYNCEKQLKTPKIKAISQRQLLKNISQYRHKKDIQENIFNHINLSRVLKIEKDLSSAKGEQYGLNEIEGSLFIAEKILKNSNCIDLVSNNINKNTSKNIKALLDNVMQGISLANHKYGFLNNYVVEFPKLKKTPTQVHVKISDYINNLNLETSEFLNTGIRPISTKLKNQEEENKFKRDKRKILDYINFIGLYKTSYRSKELNIAIEEKVNERDNDLTSQQYKRNHKQFLIERLIVFNGLNHLIELEVKSRKYSTLTSHPKVLRKFTTFNSFEFDMQTAYPVIVANHISRNLRIKKQSENFDIYDIKGLTRDEAKVVVNKTLNTHINIIRKDEWKYNLMKYVHLSSSEADLFIKRFSKKGSFFEYASAIEKDVIKNASDKVSIIGATTYRLHDAIIVFGKINLIKDLEGFDNQGFKYNFKVA